MYLFIYDDIVSITFRFSDKPSSSDISNVSSENYFQMKKKKIRKFLNTFSKRIMAMKNANSLKLPSPFAIMATLLHEFLRKYIAPIFGKSYCFSEQEENIFWLNHDSSKSYPGIISW